MHHLERIRQDLQESLSLDKHPVALLIGAGCPVSIRVPNDAGTTDPLIPDVYGLTRAVEQALADDASFRVLAEQFEQDGRTNHTIEDLLSHVRLLSRIVGVGNARGLTLEALKLLEKALCEHVARAVRKTLPGNSTPYHLLADWINGVPRRSPLTLFTTNYDLLLEQALEDRGVAYFDGFIGSGRPFFDLRAIEDDELPARWTRLWKVHGSINWRTHDAGSVVRVYEGEGDQQGLLIHPSELKYDQSRRMPYLAMIDRLRHFLRQPSALLVSVGYSYSDEHLNEVLIQGLKSNPTAAAYGLLFRKLEEETGASAVSPRLPHNLTLAAWDSGVVRGVTGPWLSERDSASTTAPTTCNLGDFQAFGKFLKNLCSSIGRTSNA